MKPTVIPNSNSSSSQNSNYDTAAPIGINIPINHEYSNVGSTAAPYHTQAQHYVPGDPHTAYGSPSTHIRVNQQQHPQQETQQPTPASYQCCFKNSFQKIVCVMKPTVIPNSNSSSSQNSNYDTAAPIGINIPINHEYSNVGSTAAPYHTQAQHYVPGDPHTAYGSPSTHIRVNQQQHPQQETQQPTPASYQVSINSNICKENKEKIFNLITINHQQQCQEAVTFGLKRTQAMESNELYDEGSKASYPNCKYGKSMRNVDMATNNGNNVGKFPISLLMDYLRHCVCEVA
uniref:Uncharacterized protein n=1 Tax=Glossina austeni TaxID=7395 RepID=A0A1A9UG78_GLOAU